jgi:hypothetical protein
VKAAKYMFMRLGVVGRTRARPPGSEWLSLNLCVWVGASERGKSRAYLLVLGSSGGFGFL